MKTAIFTGSVKLLSTLLTMAEINTMWVKSDIQRELYAKAQALGADVITLSSEIGARTFVETKDRTLAGIPPTLPPISSNKFFYLLIFNH